MFSKARKIARDAAAANPIADTQKNNDRTTFATRNSYCTADQLPDQNSVANKHLREYTFEDQATKNAVSETFDQNWNIVSATAIKNDELLNSKSSKSPIHGLARSID